MQTKRMFTHDYTRPGFYMITILTAARRPIFGECHDNTVQLSAIGELIHRRWVEIPNYRPPIEASTLVVMPDHLHGILYVKEQLPKPVGNTIRGFKSGATSAIRKLLGDPTLQVWEENYHDRVIMNADTLHTERHYIRDNPRRYCVKKASPGLFVRVNHLTNPRLPGSVEWSGYGNLFLLNKPDLMPVQVSRQIAPNELMGVKSRVTVSVRRGTVMVSPFISPGEKEIASLVMEQDYGSLILLKPDGFPPLYKPSGAYFDLCAQGRLLVLSAFRYTGHRQKLTRQRCLQMNEWVKELCGNNAAAQ